MGGGSAKTQSWFRLTLSGMPVGGVLLHVGLFALPASHGIPSLRPEYASTDHPNMALCGILRDSHKPLTLKPKPPKP